MGRRGEEDRRRERARAWKVRDVRGRERERVWRENPCKIFPIFSHTTSTNRYKMKLFSNIYAI